MSDIQPVRVAGQRGRLPRKPEGERYDLKWAHEYFADPIDPSAISFPVNVTGGITDLGMQDNDNWGDCAEAGEVHYEMTTAVGAGSSWTPDPHLALKRAQQFAGFGETPPGPGTSLPDYLQALYKAGLIKAWCPVDHTNRPLCIAIMQRGFGLYIGVNLYDANMGQFNANQPLDVTPAGTAPDIEDGHCVLWAESDALDADFDGIGTWGVWAKVTLAWMQACLHTNQNGEAYLIVTTEEQAAQFTPELFAEVAALGGGEDQSSTPPAPNEPPEGELAEIGHVVEDVVHDGKEFLHRAEEDVRGVFGRSAGDVSHGPTPRK